MSPVAEGNWKRSTSPSYVVPVGVMICNFINFREVSKLEKLSLRSKLSTFVLSMSVVVNFFNFDNFVNFLLIVLLISLLSQMPPRWFRR